MASFRLVLLVLFFVSSALVEADVFEWVYIDPQQPGLGKQADSALVPDGAGLDVGMSGQLLTGLDLTKAYLPEASLENKVLISTNFARAYLKGASLRSARAEDTSFKDADLSESDLRGTSFRRADLEGAIFRSANLTGARLEGAHLADALFEDAIITGVLLEAATEHGFSAAQLYSTASYKTRSLAGIDLSRANLSGWDFNSQDLSDADLSHSNLDGAIFTDAVIREVNLYEATERGLTESMFKSTASYKARELGGLVLDRTNMSGWDLSSQDMRQTSFVYADLSGANLAGANLSATLIWHSDLTGANLSGGTFHAAFRDSDLTNADLSGADLSNADFSSATIVDANFGNSIIRGAKISRLSTAELYGTASYQSGDLQSISLERSSRAGIDFAWKNLTGAHLSFVDFTDANFYAATLIGVGFGATNLTNADFRMADLTGAGFGGATFSGTDFRGANLTNVGFGDDDLTGADFTDAIILGARFFGIEATNLSQEQLESTASFKSGDLRGIRLRSDFDSTWNFSNQDLRGAVFSESTFSNVNWTGTNLADATLRGSASGEDFSGTTSMENIYFASSDIDSSNFSGVNLLKADLSNSNLTASMFRGANLRGARLFRVNATQADFRDADLREANLSASNLTFSTFDGAKVAGARLSGVVEGGFTKEMLYATESYQSRDLQSMVLTDNDFSGINLSSQDLSHSNFGSSSLAGADLSGANLEQVKLRSTNLTGANFTGANIRGADLYDASRYGFTIDQLVSTASFHSGNLSEVDFTNCDLSGVDLQWQDLRGTILDRALLTSASFVGADIRGTVFNAATYYGWTKEHLYATASYQDGDLTGIRVAGSNLSGWDFSSQDLTGANFSGADLADTNFGDATIVGASFAVGGRPGPSILSSSQLYSTASYQKRDLRGLNLSNARTSGWDFSHQYLVNASLGHAENADFEGADLRGTWVASDYVPENTIGRDGTILGFSLAADQWFNLRNYAPPVDGGPSIAVNIERDFNSAAGSTILIELDDLVWNSTVSFESGIPVLLGGTLQLNFADGVDVTTQVGRTFQLFDWSGVSQTGAFDVTSDYVWNLSNLYITGEITLLATLPGDFNSDGQVNLADYTVWRDSLGQTGTDLAADANGDSVVDALDYAEWKVNFGRSSPSTSSIRASNVPEPKAVIIAGLLLAIIGVTLRWRDLSSARCCDPSKHRYL